MERLKTVLFGALGMLLLWCALQGYAWTRARYAEFLVMRFVVVNAACQKPAEAAKIGITCDPSGNRSPGAPTK